jgi:hypothetical protein
MKYVLYINSSIIDESEGELIKKLEEIGFIFKFMDGEYYQLNPNPVVEVDSIDDLYNDLYNKLGFDLKIGRDYKGDNCITILNPDEE